MDEAERGEAETEQCDDPGTEEAASPHDNTPFDSPGNLSEADGEPEPAITALQIISAPALPASIIQERRRPRRQRLPWWPAGSLLLLLIVILGAVRFVPWRDGDTCATSTSGVTLYSDLNYQGQCHTFAPGDYELRRFGLAQNVSSIKDPNNAYHIKLFDKDKNFYNLDQDTPALPAEWDKRADMIHVEKHRPTTCHPGTDGIVAFLNTDYSGGCIFITHDIPDLAALNFEDVMVSILFVGSYQNSKQLVLYKQPHYHEECGTYWQNQSDLLQCARIAQSVQVLPFTPPTPIPTRPGTQAAGNVAPLALLSPGSARAAIDGNLNSEWIGGHQGELALSWPFPVTIHRIVVWDRKQSATDNNQTNKLKLVFSDGTATGSLDMVSSGPRCVDVTFPVKTIIWLHIIPFDASGNNGLREVEVWATTGPQYSNNTCVNKVTLAQSIPQAFSSFIRL